MTGMMIHNEVFIEAADKDHVKKIGHEACLHVLALATIVSCSIEDLQARQASWQPNTQCPCTASLFSCAVGL